MEPLRIFDNFRLEELDETWSKSVWDGEFLTFKDPPDSYLDYINTEDVAELLKDCSAIIKAWISEGKDSPDPKSTEVSWQTLISLNINPRELLPVIGYLIKSGQYLDADEDARQSCLKSSILYFSLLSVPGSNAFHVFHPNLYHLALNTFKLSERLVEKSRKSAADLTDLYDVDGGGKNSLIESEKLTLTKGLNSLMFNVTTMLREFSLRDNPRSLEITVHLLLQVAKLARETIGFEQSSRRSEASVGSLSYNAYIALHLLCNPNHGEVDVTVRLIAKYLLPNLVSNPGDLIPRELAAVRETMTNFLERLLEAHKEEARLAFSILIQHLMTKCPERVDARLKQAAVILRLIGYCKGEIYTKSIEDLVALAHNGKINLRIFAQEIIGRFLMENFKNGSGDSKIKKALIATVLGRCVDSSSLVRGKAMSIISDCTDPENNVALTVVKDIFEATNPEKSLPNVETLQQSISDDVDPLPGSKTIISILVARVNDERAFVRRSALQTLGNLVHLFSGLLNTLTPALGLHCRDPAIIVRRYSVQIYTQLVEKFPEHPLLPQEWVRHVLPQIFDIEVKVQEKVLESLQQLILNNITYFDSAEGNPRALLPWAILNQITEQKMRKHLTKACAVWVKTTGVSDTLISKINSHLETKNNIPAWVLLAAIAKYRRLPNINDRFENYRDILDQNTFQSNLMVEVMRNSWSNMDKSFLRTLQPDLFQCLSNFQVNFSLVSMCCDLYSDLTKYLHPEEGDKLVKLNALDLMKLSEAQLEKFVDHEDSGGEESLQIYLKAMATLGNASHLCTGSISSSTLRVLQGIVVEWDSLPEAVRYLSELRAAAVTVLGQQAMRDREDAQEILPVLGYLIRTSTAPNSRIEPAVKINAAKALADICIRFTALVEPYLPDMCVSMKDPDPIIREAIVVLFIQLLLEDFIKVKGPFFFHILTMLTDTDEMVRDLTVFLIKERLLVKNKTLIFRQLLESVFHFNNYKIPTKFSSNKISHREITALTLPGRRNRAHRKVIYNFMVEHLEPGEKLKIICRLTSEILSAVICGTINAQKEEGLSVLKDCLYILSTEELQSGFTAKRTEDDCQDENTTMDDQPVNNAANAIANEIKKHRIEVLIPTLVKLKKMLTKISSPFADYVIKYYLNIVKEYKREQLTSLFSEYPNLENEINRDLKKYGSKLLADDANDKEASEEGQPQIGQATNNHALIRKDRMPRIVLRRLSSLTYPGINRWRSPSQSSQSDEQSPQLRPSNNQNSIMMSPNRCTEAISPPSSQPGPSNSTPTTSKHNKRPRQSPICSPILAQSSYPLKSPKRKALPIITDDEEESETPRKINNNPIAVRRKKARRNLRCLTPKRDGEDLSTESDAIETSSSESD